MKKPKIAIAGFIHETNTFSPYKTPISEFENADGWPAATRGEAVISQFRDLNIGIGGFITEGTDFDLVPILWCSAEPAGLVTQEAFNKYCGEICDALGACDDLDGVLLDLHGAMVVEGIEDGEGEILRRVRQTVGEIPIVISLDFHANISPNLVELCSAIALYREYPHLDMADTGKRATKLIRHILESGTEFAKSFRQVSYLVPLSSQATGGEPFATIFSDFEGIEVGEVVSVDAAAGFPPSDIHDCGPSVLAYATTQVAADRATEVIFERFVVAEALMPDNLLSEEQAILKAAQLLNGASAPVVLADVQDNPGAGGTNSTTGVLNALVRLDLAPAIVGILTDAAAIDQAFQVGAGGILEIALGASMPFGGGDLTYEILAISAEKIMCTGAMYKDTAVDIGRTALLKVKGPKHDIRVMIADERFQCLDLGLLRHFGHTLEAPQIIVVKSTAHFRADFEPLAQEILLVRSPGLHPCTLTDLKYKNLRQGVSIVG